MVYDHFPDFFQLKLSGSNGCPHDNQGFFLYIWMIKFSDR